MRTTLSINDRMYRILKRQALERGVSLSALVEDALKYQVLEDAEDIEDARKRYGEPNYKFADLVRELQDEGLL